MSGWKNNSAHIQVHVYVFDDELSAVFPKLLSRSSQESDQREKQKQH